MHAHRHASNLAKLREKRFFPRFYFHHGRLAYLYSNVVHTCMVPDYSSTGESELVSHLIEGHQDNLDGDFGADELAIVEPEAHYNHYGDRGAADLYVEEVEHTNRGDIRRGYLYEVKSAHAVREANGAGDIIRQFNKMQRYFFQDESWTHPNRVQYELVFLPTPTTVGHVAANETMYEQLDDKDPQEDSSMVVFRAPDELPHPGHAYLNSPYDDVRKNLVSTRDDYARAAGVEAEVFHEVGRDFHEDTY
jgi:hypothetical protein